MITRAKKEEFLSELDYKKYLKNLKSWSKNNKKSVEKRKKKKNE